MVPTFDALPQPFSRAEAIAMGATDRDLRVATAVGLLSRLSRGLYAVREAWEVLSPWEQHRQCAASAARLTPDAIVSHASGAALLGLPHPAYPPKKVAMTLLDDVRTSHVDSWRTFHRGATPAEHIVIRRGVPGFVVSRIAIDAARELHGRDALAIVDGALRAGLVTREDLLAMRRHQRRWPGVASANDVLVRTDPRHENWLESASAWSIAAWAMPRGVPQANVFTPDGEFVGRPDRVWPEHGLVGEADGLQKYLLDGATDEGVQGALLRERERERGMRSLGLQFVRWTPKDAIDGTVIHDRFQRLADPTRGARVRAVYRCSCCGHPLEECEVEADLDAWRRRLSREFARTVW